jgi:hypothetical protein
MPSIDNETNKQKRTRLAKDIAQLNKDIDVVHNKIDDLEETGQILKCKLMEKRRQLDYIFDKE